MSKFADLVIPFRVRAGGTKEYLGIDQVYADPSLQAFIDQWPNCFEYLPYLQIFEYYPKGDSPNPAVRYDGADTEKHESVWIDRAVRTDRRRTEI